ncbi:Sec-independent protein translocase protein TatB [Marinomonas sp. FW-1]|uniref:Sec-independent protein translocase protein TatB n=1 Tax=Marinomonas sp. FW-1 TaxID=2071621 RepID=UPI0020C8283C|nr:Sec-independent protein translocase protein TatB [Marinomonas sp. FW-1]
MFDIGFSELLVVFVVGLLILGPERLPHAAKTAGLWVRKIRRSISSVQREINAQLDHEELQQKINETNQRLLKEGQAIQNTITPYPEGYKAKDGVVSETQPLEATAEAQSDTSEHKKNRSN